MTELTAADLQKLEGAPDPFPSLNDAPAPKQAAEASAPDTESESAFPSLAPVSAPTQSTWGAGPRIKAAQKTLVTDTFTLTAIDLSAGEKPKTLGEIMRSVQNTYKVQLDASTNQKTKQTVFVIRHESHKELEKAKKALLSALPPVVKLYINAPVSTISTIIGPKGATLTAIRNKTNVRVDIPPRDSIPSTPVNGSDDEQEEPTVRISIEGPQPMAVEAQSLINAVIATKTSRSTQRVKDIPIHILPFVKARRGNFLAVADSSDINLTLADREIPVSGDRAAVTRVTEAIKATVEGFSSSVTSAKTSLPKRTHRLLVGKAVDEILARSKCSVVVSPPDEPSDEVTIWGQPADIGAGFTAVMTRANSQYIHEFPLPGPIQLSKQYLAYMTRIGYPNTLSKAHPGVHVHTPHPSILEKAQSVNIDIVGEKTAVDAVVRQVSEFIGKLIGATKEVSIDWLLHRIITGKHAKKVKQFHDAHNVSVYFPAESLEQSLVPLVYDPLSPSASPSPVEKEQHLSDVAKELQKLAKDVADVKSETISIEQKWHEAVIGKNRTTLNAIIGEDTTLSIKFGAEAGEGANEDSILIRGLRSDVERAIKEIRNIVESAKDDQIHSNFSLEFEIEKEYVGRIVGAQGAGINKLRDQLGVKVDVSDDDEKEVKETGKKKKSVHSKSKVKITGRKENVEEAKKRVLAQVERLADETSEVLKIPAQYHSGLIGQSGKYAIRLEEKYAVKITFPRSSGNDGEGKTHEQLKTDEVLTKGGKKGVAQAKAELLDAVEFEKESNNTIKFTVPTRSIARILGKSGAQINEIKDTTDAQIDIEKTSAETTNITARGTKKAIAAARAAILEISNQVGEEVTETITIENKFHRSVIGSGGQNLKELIAKVGGPSDSRQQAGLVHFPRQNEPSDEVRLRGEAKLVAKIKAELEKVVGALRDRVILAVEVPSAQHRALIGRGGQHLNELQDRTGAQIQFPGSRSYNQVGEPENAADLASVDAANLVKVTGPRAAVDAAIKELKSQIKAPSAPTESKNATATISVPLKYHHAISQQGSFFRTLRGFGVSVDQSAHPKKSAIPTAPSTGSAARIDEDDETPAVEAKWHVAPNYADAEEGDSEWTLRGRDQAGIDRATKAIKEAIENAEKMSHVGFLTLPNRNLFPRIVGSKGANVSRLRAETGADITVSREDTTIVIIGSESAINAAKDAILKMGSNNNRGRRDEY